MLHIFQQACRHVQAPPYRRKYRQINLILSLSVLSAEGTISMKFSSLQSSLLQILSIFSNLRKAQLLLHISQIVDGLIPVISDNSDCVIPRSFNSFSKLILIIKSPSDDTFVNTQITYSVICVLKKITSIICYNKFLVQTA